MSVSGRETPVHGRPRGRHEAALQLERHEHLVEDDLRFQVHRDSKRQLHFDSKFEHEEMVLVA